MVDSLCESCQAEAEQNVGRWVQNAGSWHQWVEAAS